MSLLPGAAFVACATTVLVALGGCAAAGFTTSGNAAELVRIRAEKDLSCPDKKIEVTSDWGGVYIAVGCGRSARYHSVCRGLQCKVGKEDEEPQPWRDRPTPEEFEAGH